MTIAISAVPVPASDESKSLPIFETKIAHAPEPDSGCKMTPKTSRRSFTIPPELTITVVNFKAPVQKLQLAELLDDRPFDVVHT
ncbi:hypothetical protein B0H17DRAFT_1214182 [Mycena rosella]|uniref:Uncharacterized protein n=1 Tax=Mycena rosella TaxID=1033263 RepID=A0AAD7CNL8_MYCRO|nr:hypothetical protein B0H17DRAFT_1214182 [Mycena rosella]